MDIQFIGNRLRLLAATLRKGTVRFYTGDLVNFYRDLHADGVPYVVLRWADQVPINSDEEVLYNDDVDHLIADNWIRVVLKHASRHAGDVKCDYYSVSGQLGTSFRNVPYFMPVLAEKLLSRRWMDARGFYRPHPDDEFLSFAYHLCYHKGLRSGISDGLGLARSGHCSQKDYTDELNKMAISVGWGGLPEPITLLTLHEMLKVYGWNMPADLMVRWPEQHPFIVALQGYERSLIEPYIAKANDITVFILREDCDAVELEDRAREMISERFTVLSEVRLDALQQERIVSQTRGGDWIEKYCKKPVLPTVAFICRNATTPGPLPISMSAKKLQKRYPHVVNTDVLIKRNIRSEINKLAKSPYDRVVVHATDNPAEAVEVMRAIFGESIQDILSTF